MRPLSFYSVRTQSLFDAIQQLSTNTGLKPLVESPKPVEQGRFHGRVLANTLLDSTLTTDHIDGQLQNGAPTLQLVAPMVYN